MKIITIFLLMVAIIVLVMIGIVVSRHDTRDYNSQYFDENGDHVYYDRSLKEKKEFARQHPSEAKSVRTFGRLFRRSSNAK